MAFLDVLFVCVCVCVCMYVVSGVCLLVLVLVCDAPLYCARQEVSLEPSRLSSGPAASEQASRAVRPLCPS